MQVLIIDHSSAKMLTQAHSEDSFPTIYSHEASRVELESQKMRMNKSSMITDRGLLHKKSHWECRVFDTPGNSMQVSVAVHSDICV